LSVDNVGSKKNEKQKFYFVFKKKFKYSWFLIYFFL